MENQELPTMTVEEVRKKIEAGETIQGVAIDRVSLARKKITTPVNLIECTIEHLDLNSSTFSEDVFVRRCEIKTLVISEATFEKKCDFEKTLILRGKSQRTQFKGDVSFESAKLCHTSFYQSTFFAKAEFGYTKYSGDASFEEVDFQKGASFVHADFPEKGVFRRSHFGGKLDFKSLESQGDIEFDEGKFDDEVLLNGSVFRLSVSFNKATLSNRTDFSHIQVGRALVLSGITLGERQGFVFKNADINHVVFSRDLVEGHIYPEQDGRYFESAREYAFLRTAFQHNNQFDDEDWAYYQFKRCERRGKRLSYNPLRWVQVFLEYFFLDWGCGYGTRPFRTLGMCFVLLAAFALCYYISPIEVPKETYYGFDQPQLTRIVYSFDISLMAFSGGYGDLPLTVRGMVKIISMAEYLIGVVLMGLFVVSFSRKIIR